MMRNKNLLLITLLLALSTTSLWAAKATKIDNAIWVDGATYGVILTDTAFNSPPEHSTDAIYSFANSGLEGQRSVAEAAPGDRDYNGGRWDVQMVVFTDLGMMIHDENGDGTVDFELTSEEEVLAHEALGHLVIVSAGVYFECPLIPGRR